MTPRLFGTVSRLPVLASALVAGALTCGVLAAPASAAVAHPGTPSGLRMNPTPINGSGNSCGYVGRVVPDPGSVDLFATVERPSGGNIGARFKVRDVAAGNSVVWNSGWVSVTPGRHEAQAHVPAGTLVEGKTYSWSVRAGVPGDPVRGRTDGCAFTVDVTSPSAPTVTSTDFPVSGGGKYAGEKGVFVFDTADSGSGVAAVTYSLNETIPVGGGSRATYDEVTRKWQTPPITVTQWGSNVLRVRTLDKAGNTSESVYAFSAPSDPNPKPPLPGDIDGDRRVDVLRTNAAGDLRMYGQGDDPAGGGRLASPAIQGRPQPNDENSSWTGILVTHRNESRYDYDDLYTVSGSVMIKYRNGKNGPGIENGYFQSQRAVVTFRPDCVDPGRVDRACVGFANDWSQVKQVVAADNLNGDVDESGDPGLNDLLTVEVDGSGTGRLILFAGGYGGFQDATVIGSTGWENLDVMSPGDVTGDGLADVWARDRTTGNIHQYASARNADGTADVAALGREQNRTLIGTGFDTAAYPKVSTEGDFDGDGKADVWAQATGGNVYTFPGTDGTAFGPAQLIAGS